MKKVLWTTAILATLAFASTGCVTRITTRAVYQDYSGAVTKKDVVDAATMVLTNNGFDIAMANDRLGVINTSYRDLNSGANTTANVLGAVAYALSPRQGYTSYASSMMVSIQVTDSGYTVVPKVKQTTSTTSTFRGDSRDNVYYPTKDSQEGKLVGKIINELNQTLGISSPFRWEEKVVEVGQGD